MWAIKRAAAILKRKEKNEGEEEWSLLHLESYHWRICHQNNPLVYPFFLSFSRHNLLLPSLVGRFPPTPLSTCLFYIAKNKRIVAVVECNPLAIHTQKKKKKEREMPKEFFKIIKKINPVLSTNPLD